MQSLQNIHDPVASMYVYIHILFSRNICCYVVGIFYIYTCHIYTYIYMHLYIHTYCLLGIYYILGIFYIYTPWKWKSRSVVSDSLWPHGLYSPWNSLGHNTGVGSFSLLQGIFPTQGWNPDLPHCRQILYQLSHHTYQIHISIWWAALQQFKNMLAMNVWLSGLTFSKN